MFRRRPHLLVFVLALVVLTSVLAGCGLSNEKSYENHGVSFNYPKGWERAKFSGLSAKNASGIWTEAFKPKSSSKADMIFITEYRTPVAITKRNRSSYSDDVASSVSSVASKADGSLLAGPTLVSMGGLPGYGFRISARTVSGLNSESRILLVWKGKTEYYLNCQHQVDGKFATEIERGCKAIISSFKLS